MEITKDQIEVLLKEADRYEDDGLSDEARKVYLKCISFDDGTIPQNEEEWKSMADIFKAWLHYACFLTDHKNWEEALKAVKRAIIYHPLKSLAYIYMGRCYQALKKPDKAEAAFRQSIESKPRPYAWVFLYDLLYHDFDDRKEEAVNCLYAALELDPNCEEAYYNLGCNFKLKGDYEAAIKHFQKAIQIDPNYAIAYAELAFTLERNHIAETGELPSEDLFEEIEGYLKKSIECNPSYGWSRCYLAYVLWHQRKIRKAYRQFKQLVKIWPDYSLSHWAIGSFLSCEEINKDKAEYHLRKAIELDPEDEFAHYYMGKALLQWKRIDEAKVALEKASTLGHEKALTLLNGL